MALNEIAKQIVDIFKKDKSYFEKLKWSAHYNKYNEECLTFNDGKSFWQFQVSNISDKCLTDNLYKNAIQLQPFYEWLGERIALSLNLMKGKTNEELEEMLKK